MKCSIMTTKRIEVFSKSYFRFLILTYRVELLSVSSTWKNIVHSYSLRVIFTFHHHQILKRSVSGSFRYCPWICSRCRHAFPRGTCPVLSFELWLTVLRRLCVCSLCRKPSPSQRALLSDTSGEYDSFPIPSWPCRISLWSRRPSALSLSFSWSGLRTGPLRSLGSLLTGFASKCTSWVGCILLDITQ